ncbi:hypothetical protein K469DRAFT_346086 [Zopfia rhizophila CBS 207.26]|uniref:Uncharacterized protein n=1 Tax=Zopfia rhizophila CBS 207.26 TaxID=1314779 RepID=A0A6A6EMJ9_9PEZI|nr:hypothetical protein K469DRAFT_346086 [Zopfia rhizophila CBS 207.26]
MNKVSSTCTIPIVWAKTARWNHLSCRSGSSMAPHYGCKFLRIGFLLHEAASKLLVLDGLCYATEYITGYHCAEILFIGFVLPALYRWIDQKLFAKRFLAVLVWIITRILSMPIVLVFFLMNGILFSMMTNTGHCYRSG